MTYLLAGLFWLVMFLVLYGIIVQALFLLLHHLKFLHHSAKIVINRNLIIFYIHSTELLLIGIGISVMQVVEVIHVVSYFFAIFGPARAELFVWLVELALWY